MQKIIEKNLLYFDNIIKVNVKEAYAFLNNFTSFVNFNHSSLSVSNELAAPWQFMSLALFGTFLRPSYIKHACSNFKTRKSDLHGMNAVLNEEETRIFLQLFALKNLKTILDDQRDFKVGLDSSQKAISFGFKDFRKFKSFRRTPLRYTTMRLGGTATFLFTERFQQASIEHISRLLQFSYFLESNTVNYGFNG